MPDDFTGPQHKRNHGRRKPIRQRGQYPAKRTRKARQPPLAPHEEGVVVGGEGDLCWRLFTDDNPRFAALRAQAEAELIDVVDAAERRLDWLIRGSFFIVNGDKPWAAAP